MIDFLQKTLRHGQLAPLDFYFARFVDQLEQGGEAAVVLGAALCMQATRQGNVCLTLEKLAGTEVFQDEMTGEGGVRLPQLTEWLAALRRSSVVGAPGEFKPLILDSGNRLYLSRYWDYEQRLAASISKRAELSWQTGEPGRLGMALGRLFPPGFPSETNWQKVATATAFLKRFCIISGGPGTGKTYTVVKILALLQELAAPDFLHIGLTAPTGKAAGRLAESIRQTKELLNLDPTVAVQIPETASTIHRLLGVKQGSPYFRHDKNNPLHLDVLIVDEASMVDLALMCKLLEAFPDQGRLILLGDKDQLASVEAGRVLGDICGGVAGNRFSDSFGALLQQEGCGVLPGDSFAHDVTPLEDSIILLEKSFRFDSAGGIGLLARTIKTGDAARITACLPADNSAELAWHSWQDKDATSRLADSVRRGYGDFLQADNPLTAFAAFNRFRILCVHRQGKLGVSVMNNWVEGLLERSGLLKKMGFWYHGRPVMISRNDYALQLYNGDIGITLANREGDLRVFFGMSDGSVRSVAPARIGEHETAFAMTVHKSQGSEFDHVVFVLPEKKSPLISRELLYTGVTRARLFLEIWGDAPVLEDGITNLTDRQSGLQELLWGPFIP
jgi:exodeoxyribonuclease V alpha subunit